MTENASELTFGPSIPIYISLKVFLSVGSDNYPSHCTVSGFDPYNRASPIEKSEEKCHRQKVKPLCLKNKATEHKSTFLAYFFCFLRPFWPHWVWAKRSLISEHQISKIYYIILKLNLVLQIIYLCFT